MIPLVVTFVLGATQGAWCSVVFKDAARAADIVVLARLDRVPGGKPRLAVVEVLRGSLASPTLALDPRRLRPYGVRASDQVLLALTVAGELVGSAGGLGECTPVPALRVRAGGLSARERLDYDGRREPMTLEELRRDLGWPGDRGSIAGSMEVPCSS
jgi:hypothetical protein